MRGCRHRWGLRARRGATPRPRVIVRVHTAGFTRGEPEWAARGPIARAATGRRASPGMSCPSRDCCRDRGSSSGPVPHACSRPRGQIEGPHQTGTESEAATDRHRRPLRSWIEAYAPSRAEPDTDGMLSRRPSRHRCAGPAACPPRRGYRPGPVPRAGRAAREVVGSPPECGCGCASSGTPRRHS